MACIALVELRQRRNARSLQATAELVYTELMIFDNETTAIGALKVMIDAGHRYHNLERRLGYGIAFLLGTSIPETSWIRLPKDGKHFLTVIERLRSAQVLELSAKYAGLRKRVVDWFLDHARRESEREPAGAGSSVASIEPNQTQTADAVNDAEQSLSDNGWWEDFVTSPSDLDGLSAD
ncbi:hypothetical protein BAUCODRAFT_570736 [Baudoinia panamericana UAMH 10762]|uniref:Uncharacterized protein n=1 Tax=Baudoinia panamericana (strain UAMH 10762) TaxID=717646 RepID=M2MKY9_BAUPA|nr:uncharacterized protein BAUCODRAFT_570736 [Baudoinia panamericana UAMH 10762]EMC91993.1 hypothetical protein BAUCODRAFT_570736 [Baudoinia panamericana UAMH 10762]